MGLIFDKDTLYLFNVRAMYNTCEIHDICGVRVVSDQCVVVQRIVKDGQVALEGRVICAGCRSCVVGHTLVSQIPNRFIDEYCDGIFQCVCFSEGEVSTRDFNHFNGILKCVKIGNANNRVLTM